VTPLGLDDPIGRIDARIANRRVGFRTKGPPAWEVLADGLGIRTVGQLLHHYPRRYIDRSTTAAIRDLRIGQEATIIGRVRGVNRRLTRRRQSMVTVTLTDGTGYLDLTFFNQPWTAGTYREGVELAVSGRVQTYGRRLQLGKQEVEVLRGADAETVHTGRITPVHPATDGITTRTIRELVYRALQGLPPIRDSMPGSIVRQEGLIGADGALRAIHFPEDPAALSRATDRLKFEELFTLELGVGYRKRRLERQSRGVDHRIDGPLTDRFLSSLPFRLTAAQRRVVKEVGADMLAGRPMNRLLQGDVGSGKTLVALYGCLVAAQSGHQATIMAPTEVLAAQHHRTTRELLAPLGARDLAAAPAHTSGQASLLDEHPSAGDNGPTVALLTANVTGKERERVLEGIREGAVDIVVGTHALVQEGVGFSDLSLAVIDEQHRFGVHQRLTLKEKAAHPDVLIMTATPIPRTLALTYYGDLDVSILDEMPAGRRPVETRVARSPDQREEAYSLVRAQVGQGRQAFVVCAAIDEGNRLDVRAAEKEAGRLATNVFPDLRVSLLHGRMRPPEKEAVMEAFRTGGTDVLISTTVIEVGVDVANATVMLVENAERFGLAQLHQLRGRIGRGAHRSFCVLFDEGEADNPEARSRLDAMVRTTDGFELADEDLRLRGEGTLFDIRQSGLPDLKLARLATDADLVRRARARAFSIVDQDPELESHPELLELLRRTFTGEAIEWLFHG
jgi:ATP-dependent DNA helicase RecG